MPLAPPAPEPVAEARAIELIQVRKQYPGAAGPAVAEVSLAVGRGEFLALVGESGSGKSTVMKMINRLVEPTAGEVRVEGRDVMAVDPVLLRRGIGYAVQGVGLLPHLTVAENIAIVPRLLGWEKSTIRQRVDELLEMVRLDPPTFRDRPPRALSGGQAQRVGLARALAARPAILLMDEPFGALDPITRDRLQADYLELHRSLGLTTVMVTHDLAEAARLADRLGVMQGGRLLRLGTPAEVWTDPGDEYVTALLESPRRQAAALAMLMGEGS
jgi:osmoprotectant transport system ATP-binding protein